MSIKIIVRGPIHTVPYFLVQNARVNTCIFHRGNKVSWEALVHFFVQLPDGAAKAARMQAVQAEAYKTTSGQKRVEFGKIVLVQEISETTAWLDVRGEECGSKKQSVIDMWTLDERLTGDQVRSDAPTRWAWWANDCPEPSKSGGPGSESRMQGCKLKTVWRSELRVALAVRKGPRWTGDIDDPVFRVNDYTSSKKDKGTVAISGGRKFEEKPKPRVADNKESHDDFLGGEQIVGSAPVSDLDAFRKSVDLLDVPGGGKAAYTMNPVVVHCMLGSVPKHHHLKGHGLVPAEDIGGEPPSPITMSEVSRFDTEIKTDNELVKTAIKKIPTSGGVTIENSSSTEPLPDDGGMRSPSRDGGGALRQRKLSVAGPTVGAALRDALSRKRERHDPGSWRRAQDGGR